MDMNIQKYMAFVKTVEYRHAVLPVHFLRVRGGPKGLPRRVFLLRCGHRERPAPPSGGSGPEKSKGKRPGPHRAAISSRRSSKTGSATP